MKIDRTRGGSGELRKVQPARSPETTRGPSFRQVGAERVLSVARSAAELEKDALVARVASDLGLGRIDAREALVRLVEGTLSRRPDLASSAIRGDIAHSLSEMAIGDPGIRELLRAVGRFPEDG